MGLRAEALGRVDEHQDLGMCGLWKQSSGQTGPIVVHGVPCGCERSVGTVCLRSATSGIHRAAFEGQLSLTFTNDAKLRGPTESQQGRENSEADLD